MGNRELKVILKANDIYAAYIKKEVLNGVSIDVKEGEIVALIGPNGAGKSTLLKVIAGFLKPKQGNIIFYDQDITKMEIYARIRMGIGYFIQGGEIFRNMTVEENLEMGFMARQKLENKDWKIGNEKWKVEKELIYELFPNLKDKRKKIAGLLSGGEKQALALGVILMTCPKILLLDEPSAGLAPNLVREFFEKIIRINKEWNISVLIVEQNVRAVLDIASRAYVMKLGRIYAEGNPETLIQREILEKAFLM